MYKLTFRRFHLLFVLCFQPKHAFAFSLTRGRLQFVSFARGRHRYFWLHSPGDTTSFSSYFVVFGVLKMSPPKTPCFAPGPATRTSVAFLLKLLHRHAKHIMLVLGSFGQIGWRSETEFFLTVTKPLCSFKVILWYGIHMFGTLWDMLYTQVERLCDRVQSSTLLEDRRDAVRALKSLSKVVRYITLNYWFTILREIIGALPSGCFGGCSGWASDSWSIGRWFDSRLGRYQVS